MGPPVVAQFQTEPLPARAWDVLRVVASRSVQTMKIVGLAFAATIAVVIAVVIANALLSVLLTLAAVVAIIGFVVWCVLYGRPRATKR